MCRLPLALVAIWRALIGIPRAVWTEIRMHWHLYQAAVTICERNRAQK